MKCTVPLPAMLAAVVTATSFAAGAAEPDPAAAKASEQQQREQRTRARFETLDRDDSGYIDEQEARAYKGLQNAFPRVAPQGRLDEAEFAAWFEEYDRGAAEE